MMRAVLFALALLITGRPALAQEAPADAPAGETWELDQLRVARDVPEAKLNAIEPDHSLDAVIKTLNGLGIAFKRVHVRILADKLPQEMRAGLLALPPGEPFLIGEEDFWSISVIVGRTLAPDSVRFLTTPRFASPRKA